MLPHGLLPAGHVTLCNDNGWRAPAFAALLPACFQGRAGMSRRVHGSIRELPSGSRMCV